MVLYPRPFCLDDMRTKMGDPLANSLFSNLICEVWDVGKMQSS